MIAARIVVAMVAGAILKMVVHHLYAPTALSQEIHGVAAYLEVLGALYSIIMAFVMFVVWDQFNGVQRGIAHESAAVEDLCRIATFLSDRNVFSRVRKEAREYLVNTTSDEKRCLAQGKMSSLAEERFMALCRSVREIQLQGDRDELVYSQLLKSLERVSEARDERLSVSTTRIPGTMWQLIVFVSAALFGGFLFLGIVHPLLAAAIVAGMAGSLTFLLSVVSDMDNPFAGVWNASYAPMTAILNRIGQI